jgi:hypothetical protein
MLPEMSTSPPSASRISWRGRAALAIFSLHVALLFFPPIPPIVSGSLVSYVLSGFVVVFAGMEVRRMAHPIAGVWGRISQPVRWFIGVAAVAGTLIAALWIRALNPTLFARFSGEEGVWEPLTLASYFCSFLLVWQIADSLQGRSRTHLRLIAGCYGILTLEEMDYASVFGGLVGRVEGVYVGALHDLINLAVDGHLPPFVIALLAAVAVTILLVLHRVDQLRMSLRTLWSRDSVWLVLGFGLLFGAAFEDTLRATSFFGTHLPEEAMEMAGGMCIGLFALQIAGKHVTRR